MLAAHCTTKLGSPSAVYLQGSFYEGGGYVLTILALQKNSLYPVTKETAPGINIYVLGKLRTSQY